MNEKCLYCFKSPTLLFTFLNPEMVVDIISDSLQQLTSWTFFLFQQSLLQCVRLDLSDQTLQAVKSGLINEEWINIRITNAEGREKTRWCSRQDPLIQQKKPRKI